MKTTYTIDRLKIPLSEDEIEYLREAGPDLANMFDNVFDYKSCRLDKLINDYAFLVCRRNGKIRGHMICYIFPSPLDINVKVLYQISFYVKPDSGRAAYYLFQKFIDIGKKSANHIITMLTSQTNIKPSTLENMGFKEVETHYRLEIQ